MKMRARIWVFGLILLGLVLLAAAGWLYFSPADGAGLIVEELNRDISNCTAGQSKVLTFPFHNRSRRPVQIIGLETC